MRKQFGDDVIINPEFPGGFAFKGPKGRLESYDERECRLAHNQRMRFNRSFVSNLVQLVADGKRSLLHHILNIKKFFRAH